MSNNGNQSVSERKSQWLDKALAEQPADVKARVLDFAIRFGVDSGDDDFWVLIAAVGYLNTIVEDAPRQWHATLSNHTKELNQWTQSNLHLIESLTLQAETGAQQAELLTELSSTLHVLTERLQEQQQHMRRLQAISSSSEKTLNNLHEGLNHRLNELSRRIDIRTTSSTQNTSGKGNHQSGANNMLQVTVIVLTAILTGLLWFGQQRQIDMLRHLINQQTSQQSLSPQYDLQAGLKSRVVPR